MAEIRWTKQAADDLEAIVTFIAHDSEFYASLTASDIVKAIERLGLFPNIGRIVPEANNPAVREIFSSHYRIIYKTDTDNVCLLTIIHGARLLSSDRIS